MTPQSNPLPRTITRVVRFDNEAGAFSIDKKKLACWQSIFKSIPARKSTLGVLTRALNGVRKGYPPERQCLSNWIQ